MFKHKQFRIINFKYNSKSKSNSVFRHKPITLDNNSTKSKRAGCIIYDPDTKKFLLVQTLGQHLKWGPPKGRYEKFDKTLFNCAIRETYEETGLKIIEKNEDCEYIVANHCTFFIIKINKNIYKNLEKLGPRECASDEIRRAEWHSINEINKFINSKYTSNGYLRRIFSNLKSYEKITELFEN